MSDDETPRRGRRDTHERIHDLHRSLDEVAGKAEEGVRFSRRFSRGVIAVLIASVGALGGGLSLLQRGIASSATRDEKIYHLERAVLRLEDRLDKIQRKDSP